MSKFIVNNLCVCVCVCTPIHNSFVLRGRGCRWSRAFAIFDLLIRSGDIRDQSRKLSEIRTLDWFFVLANFWGLAFQKLYPRYHPCLAARRLQTFREDTPTNPEVIDSNTLNFTPKFKFLPLKLFGKPLSHLGMCASKAWSISSACKNLRWQHP